ncbi:MAG: FAD-binding protein [Planctomycetota bacterium]|nr:FAD-binding protein [Planctomycetota bacterium]MDA1249000.1 FAD-binding protein [Planctomycetota bacterium]
MNEQQTRIIEDLSGVFSGEVRCDSLAVSMYASDASLFEVRPLGVAFPRSTDDVVTLARYASETDLPLVARGAGTNVTGSALGRGLIVDFSRHMNEIVSIDDATVTVQPGVVLNQLNRRLREVGRYFPPDPAMAAVRTIGGMLGVDSAGSRAVRVGSTRDHVVDLEMVIAGGHVLNCGLAPLHFPRISAAVDSDDQKTLAADSAVRRSILSRLAKVLQDNAELIERHQPPMVRNTSGYFLRGVHRGEEINLPRMLVGSEGTLGMFTSATLHTSPLPEFRGVALLLFGEMDDAIDSVLTVMPQQPSACDLIDRRLLSLGRENDSRFERLIPLAAEAGLLIEQTGYSESQTRDRIEMAILAIRTRHPDVQVACEAYDYDDVEFLWELPRKVVTYLTRIGGLSKPVPFIEDYAVPPEATSEFFAGAQRILQKHEVTASLYAHAASGQVHMRPFIPAPREKDGPKINELMRELNELAISLGGTISGEHGDGLSRSAFVKQQYGELYSVFRQVKEIFDPHNLMNPGKIVTEETSFPASRLRRETRPPEQLVQLKLNWSPEEIVLAGESCNGCGGCRTQEEDFRMCPFFRVDPSEEASPRSKANVFRSFISGRLNSTVAASPELAHLASLCFNCKQCELECPTNAPIPRLMIEAKAQAVEANGLDRATWILSRAHSFSSLGCRFSWLANSVIRSGIARWIMEKTIGIHRRRKLPRFARIPFLESLPDTDEPAIERSGRVVVFFVDHFANYHDPELAEAFVAIMEHHKIRVIVPSGQTVSGMAMISAGDLGAARKVAESNIRQLAQYARDGLQIVCVEPAAALCLSQEYPSILADEDAGLIATQTIEAGAYLQQLHEEGSLKTEFEPLPLRLGYHTPCHLMALKKGEPLRQLMSLIPELDVVPLDKGCSGMAGTFGLTRENFDTSIRMGYPLIERMQEPDLIAGATECSSCRMQMEQATKTPTLHPLKILAAAYGLLPGVRDDLLLRVRRAGRTART